jgi:hypothetical protein
MKLLIKGGRMNQLIIGFEPPGHRVQQVRQGMECIVYSSVKMIRPEEDERAGRWKGTK